MDFNWNKNGAIGMTNIAYTYTIENVNEELKTMEITYMSAVYGATTVGAHLPYSDEDLETVVAQYQPVQEWLNRDRTYMTVATGTTGTITATVYLVGEEPVVEELVVEELVVEEPVVL